MLAPQDGQVLKDLLELQAHKALVVWALLVLTEPAVFKEPVEQQAHKEPVV
jgi:hypothetical protein